MILNFLTSFFAGLALSLISRGWIFPYYRDKESNEIDVVLESDGMLHPVEIKKSSNPGSELIGAFDILDKASVPRGTGAILCLKNELSAIDRRNLIVPAWMI